MVRDRGSGFDSSSWAGGRYQTSYPKSIMNQTWRAADAENLKTRRQQAGLERAQLAHQAAISGNQLRQLEGEAGNFFYSHEIMTQSGKKLLDWLEARSAATAEPAPGKERPAPAASKRADAAHELERVVRMSQSSLNCSALQQFGRTLGRFLQEHLHLTKLVFFLLVLVLATIFFNAALQQISVGVLVQPRKAELVHVPAATLFEGPETGSAGQAEKARAHSTKPGD